MWTSTNFKLLKKKHQFFGGAKKTEITTLLVDDIVFINNIDALTNQIENDQSFQSIICEGDGIYHCEFGNWLSIRKCGNYILFLTAFDKIIENPIEYFPPNWILEKGAFYLTTNEFEKCEECLSQYPCAVTPTPTPTMTLTPSSVQKSLYLQSCCDDAYYISLSNTERIVPILLSLKSFCC
jgi:hypothetical protein